MITDEMVAAARNEFIAVSHESYFPSNEQIRCVLEAAERAAWRPATVENVLPGVKVVAIYKNSHGRDRSVMAVFYDRYQREHNHDSDDLDCEYCEERDAFFWPAGWYEMIENWDDYTHVAMDAPTHFRPLPTPPEAA